LVFSIPFGTRKLVRQFTEGFSEYNSAFIYLTDILLLTLILFYSFIYFFKKTALIPNSQFPIPNDSLKIYRFKFHWILGIGYWIFLCLAALSVIFAYSKGLAIYNFLRLLILAVFALITTDLLKKQIFKIDYIFGFLAASAVFQAILGILQFIKQSSVGLYFLGEPHLSNFGDAISKIVVEGAKVLRAYGTLPHPNILAGFLILGLFGFYYLYLKDPPPTPPPSGEGGGKRREFLPLAEERERKNPLFSSPLNPRGDLPAGRQGIKVGDIVIVLGIAILILGLILTFSRAAWLVGGGMSALFVGYLSFRPETRRAGLQLIFITCLSAAAFVFTLYPYVAARAPINKNEPSVTRRLQYNEMALEIIKNKPSGVGLGNQVLFSVREGYYQKFGMDKPWMWEPIHNTYLLIGVELGLAGFIIVGWFIFKLLISNIQYPISNFGFKNFIGNWELVIGNLMLITLLFLALFDHYLWTIQQGRLMLWLVIGLTLCNTMYYNTKYEKHH
jgi:hypothetical protein